MAATVMSADGIALHYEVHGTGTPALVFVHGWSCDRTYWRAQVDHFATAHQVITIDLAGHGESGLGRLAYTMPSFGQDVVAVLEALNLSDAVLIGHSMGGDVIVEAALTAPHRVAGLVWVDVYRSLSEPGPDESHEDFIAPFRAEFATAAQAFIRRAFKPGTSQELIEWVAADIASAPPEVALDVMKHAVYSEGPTIAGLAKVKVPVVSIHSDSPAGDLESLARHGVRAVLQPSAGHFPMMEDPQTFNRLLDGVVQEMAPRS